jgi:hypothetical protein
VALELPEQWLWDIIDEFIYQFQVFCTWRSKVKSKSDDELVMLADGGQVGLLPTFIIGSRIKYFILGLELLQCAKRLVFLDPKVQNQ